jgi:hypothetical protein
VSPPTARKPKLTDRQARVLAAVERIGRPSMLDLWGEIPGLAPSAIKRVLDSLQKKGLVARAGDPDQVYLGGVRWWSTAIAPTQRDPRLAQVEEALEQAGVGLGRVVDESEGAVTVYLPLSALEDFLGGIAVEEIEQIRGCVWRLERDRLPVRVSVGTRMISGPETKLAVKIEPLLPEE